MNANRFVIRAKGCISFVYFMETPYLDEDVVFHFSTHPRDAVQFTDLELAEKMASLLPYQHANPVVVPLAQATKEHTLPPADFPFSVYAIATDDELAASMEPEQDEPEKKPAIYETVPIF